MQYAKYAFTGFNAETVSLMAENSAKILKEFEFSRFMVGCTFQNALSDEARMLLKKEFQPVLVRGFEKALNAKADFENPELEITVNFNQDLVFFHLRPVFITGRYKKFSREITQTKHFCFKCLGKGCGFCGKTGLLTPESVQSLVEKHALPLFGASSAKFHGAGREDKDVRMLGNGRQFVLELLEPKKRSPGLKHLRDAVNREEAKKMEISGLEFCQKEAVARLKESKNSKLYEAKVSCEQPIDSKKAKALSGKSLEIVQRTPVRVSKRRADLERKRKAEIKSIEITAKKELKLQVIAESGLYVKEFVSGDEGRTNPSFSSLLENKCSCKELDVMEIMESPAP
ncbi:MAG: tRNA pseudouridine(54/55) synthase Pus10 [Candidatus Diapherotrites archaeon]|nr:tRNA pseudouridine(54/55) synthase Pus10 [Candidatus Diapherotrites archaeon]